MSMQQNLLPNQRNYTWWIDILFLFVVLGGLFFILLGIRPLFVPDEGRYAEIGREMVTSGNYITPYLNGIKYFEKPILFYWLESAAIKLAGLNLWSLRSINALLGLFGCLLTYITARQLYNRATGLLASFMLGTSMLYFVMAHMISLDLTVTVFITASLYAFLLGMQHQGMLADKAEGVVSKLSASPPAFRSPHAFSGDRFYFWGASIAAALAVLTKGLIGLVFPGMIIFAWMAIMNEWRILKHVYLPSCLIIFLIIAAPWHILVGKQNPEFFYFYFIEQHFLRYATKEVGHYQPFWFFIPYLMIGFFPWIVFLPQAIARQWPVSWQQRHQYKREVFFLLWIFLIFVFFSCSNSKLIPYILPVFPPLAILTARYLQQAIAKHQYRGIKVGYIMLLILVVIIVCALSLFTHYISVPDPVLAQHHLLTAATFLMMGSVLACFYAFRNNNKAIIITLSTSWLFLLTALAAIPSVETRTIAPLAMLLKPILKPHDDIIAYNQYYQDLPFYLERPISVLNWRNELSYGIKHQKAAIEWMIDDNRYWQLWHSNKRIFVMMAEKEYQHFQLAYPHEKTFLLGKTTHNVLLSNQP